MPTSNRFLEDLGLMHPIIQAPMAGGGDTPALVAAVSEAGGFGSIGATYLTPDKIREAAESVRSRTNRGFGINLFAPMPLPKLPENPKVAVDRMAGYYAELGLPAPTLPESGGFDFREQLDVALESGASVFSFTFGIIPDWAIQAIKKKGMRLMGTATTVAEAVALEEVGADAIVAQGAEAGGHRGTFAGSFEAAMVGTMALVPQIVDAVRIPVVASGGIMDGRGIAAALALGASAVQMGTAFLTCDEAGIPDVYKDAILEARDSETRITRAFSGRPARGIVNRLLQDFEAPGSTDKILPFPYQNALTRPLRTAAAKAGRAEFLSLWAGQGVGLARRQSAAELVARLVEETNAAIRTIGAR